MLQLATKEHALLGQEGGSDPVPTLRSVGERLSSPHPPPPHPRLHFLQLPREPSPPEDGPLCRELDQSLSLIREDKQCGDWAGPSSLLGGEERSRRDWVRLAISSLTSPPPPGGVALLLLLTSTTGPWEHLVAILWTPLDPWSSFPFCYAPGHLRSQ